MDDHRSTASSQTTLTGSRSSPASCRMTFPDELRVELRELFDVMDVYAAAASAAKRRGRA
jgi:hypothetical protein